MLPSGADCACALAKKSAGSEKKFVALMNKKAKKLKMSRTHFSNPVGSDSRGTYTTTNDLTKLLKYALKNKTFRKVFTSKKHKVPVTNITKKKEFSEALYSEKSEETPDISKAARPALQEVH